ncbi:E3 ubiquitin-protein ligase KEG [Linum perenne]
MAGKVVPAHQPVSFEYELYEGDPDNLRTVVVSSSQSTPWIDPATLKLRQRIGRGPFGDVWLATLHRAVEVYGESHEVAVKMLYPVKEDHIGVLLDKFNDLFLKREGLGRVALLHGISVLNGKVCLVMKFYEGSVGDKIAFRKAGKLPLSDVLRYGTQLAEGINEMHSKDILVLNVKPSNFLVNENDEAVLGDVGIPYILLGIQSSGSDMCRRLGTPNYMAPEQWQPEVRGPLSVEADSWGLGCSVVEMLTGVQPWCGRSVEEIYDLVVIKHKKPTIPDNLPPPVKTILHSCFEYDFRNRPLMTDVLHVFRRQNELCSSRNAVYGDDGWTGLDSILISEESGGTSYAEWSVSKDHLQIGDVVRSRKPCYSCKPENMQVPEGIVVGTEQDTNSHGFILVRVHGIHDPLRVPAATLERVSFGLASGDWVRLKEEGLSHSPVGILHSIARDGSVAVGFIGLDTFWKGYSSQLQMAEAYFVGQFVRLKANILSPKFEWPRASGGGAWATGKISWILPNGCLVVKFPGRLPFGKAENSTFHADPAEVETVSFGNSPGIVKKYQHLEDFHWSVRPLLIALGLFTAMKVGFSFSRKFGRSKVKNGRSHLSVSADSDSGSSNNTSKWLPRPVSNILGSPSR